MKPLLGGVAIMVTSFSGAGLSAGIETDRHGLNDTPEMQKAEVFVRKPEGRIRGILVLCPGQNGNGHQFTDDPAWWNFAKSEGLALAGIHFVSRHEDLASGRGYFVASHGSGKVLETALAKAGLGDLPIFLYGFSGGAHFAMSYASWRPERVTGFCAYSFAWWTAPALGVRCPALIVCGTADAQRYGSSFGYFQAGRSQGLPWTWTSLRDQGHETSPELDAFAREYFRTLLRTKRTPVEVDNLTEAVVERSKFPVGRSGKRTLGDRGGSGIIAARCPFGGI